MIGRSRADKGTAFGERPSRASTPRRRCLLPEFVSRLLLRSLVTLFPLSEIGRDRCTFHFRTEIGTAYTTYEEYRKIRGSASPPSSPIDAVQRISRTFPKLFVVAVATTTTASFVDSRRLTLVQLLNFATIAKTRVNRRARVYRKTFGPSVHPKKSLSTANFRTRLHLFYSLYC